MGPGSRPTAPTCGPRPEAGNYRARLAKVPAAKRLECQTRVATTLGQQAGGAILFDVTEQAEYLTPVQAHQRTGIGDPQPA
jgi:hypothetical protein